MLFKLVSPVSFYLFHVATRTFQKGYAAHICGLHYISFGQCQGSTQQTLKNVQLLFLGISHCKQKKYWFDMPLYGPVVTLTTLKKQNKQKNLIVSPLSMAKSRVLFGWGEDLS